MAEMKSDNLYVVSLALGFASKRGDLHILFIESEEGLRPVTCQDRVVIFTRHEDVTAAIDTLMRVSGDDIRFKPEPYVLRVHRFVELVRASNGDRQEVIVHAINMLDDILACLKVPIPEHYKSILYRLADHLTFHRGFQRFLRTSGIDREEVVNAFEWCLGAGLARGLIVNLSERKMPALCWRSADSK